MKHVVNNSISHERSNKLTVKGDGNQVPLNKVYSSSETLTCVSASISYDLLSHDMVVSSKEESDNDAKYVRPRENNQSKRKRQDGSCSRARQANKQINRKTTKQASGYPNQNPATGIVSFAADRPNPIVSEFTL